MGDLLHLPSGVDEVCDQLETYAAWRNQLDPAEAAACMGISSATAARLEATIQILLAVFGATS